MFQKFTTRLSSAMSVGSSTTESEENEEGETRPSITENMRLPSLPSQESLRVSSQESLTLAATSMMGFMRKAQVAATDIVKEGSTKARQVIASTDMDALQKRMNHSSSLEQHSPVNLEELNFTYLCDNVIAMGYPASTLGCSQNKLSKFGPLKFNSIHAVAHVLNENHQGKYMIWNLSEEPYDYALFHDCVMEFNFPGHPAPPLSLLFKICTSMENWLNADTHNVAAVHCLTGKGRTSTVLACYLCWSGVVSCPLEGLAYICTQRHVSLEKMTIPSQRRYIQYFGHMMDRVKPRSGAMILKRAILNGIPNFSGGTGTRGCRPYLQVFKHGKLVFTTTWKKQDLDEPGPRPVSSHDVEYIAESEGSMAFTVDCLVQGDILIRCRHVTRDGRRISMFRAAFHTGYVPLGIFRLTKIQLDGACQDSRFEEDFFIDLIFAPIQTEDEVLETSRHSDDDSNNLNTMALKNPQSEGLILARKEQKAYDDMLDRDEQFWTDIQRRKERLKTSSKRKSNFTTSSSMISNSFSIDHQEDNSVDELVLTHTPQETTKIETILAQTSRKDSWGEDQDADLLAQLESIETKPGLARSESTTSVDKKDTVTTTTNDLSLDFMEDDLADLNLTDDLPNTDDGLLGDIDLENDDFGELEEYLEGIEQ